MSHVWQMMLAALAAAGAQTVSGATRIPLGDNSAAASSTYYISYHREPTYAVNGAGLNGSQHTNTADYVAWMSAPQTSTVSGQWFRVDLGQVVPLDHLKLWNFNYWHATVATTNRGIREAEIYVSRLDMAPGSNFGDTSKWTRVIDKVTFAKAPGSNTYAGEPDVSLQGMQGRWLALRVLSNHSSTDFTVGISELQVSREDLPITTCVPTEVSAVETSPTAAQVAWAAPTNVAAVAGYRVFRDGIFLGTSVTTNFSDAGPLDMYRSYAYAVSACDAEGHTSISSDVTIFAYRRFPFAIPWDDAETNSVADMSGLSPNAADTWITATNGHLYAGASQIRFFGVNAVFGVCFPTNSIADKFAARLAKLGVNCVRFHGMDNNVTPNGIFVNVPTNNPAYKRGLDPAQLDKLDYLISRLKARGIYADLNLHVQRSYAGYPTNGVPTNFKAVDIFMPGLVDLQKEYARDLLTHVNPYTGNAYTNEPAVAFVEINNENGIIRFWHAGTFDAGLHTNYTTELSTQWNNWLTAKYTNTATLAAAWAPTAGQPYGAELLTNGTFEAGFIAPWTLSVSSPAVATQRVIAAGAPSGAPALQVSVTGPSSNPADVALCQAGLSVNAGQSYTVSFWARAEAVRTIHVGFTRQSDPQHILGDTAVTLTVDWQKFTVVIVPAASDAVARFNIGGLALQTGQTWFAGFSVATGNTLLGPQSARAEGVTGPEMLTNGNFADGFVSPWTFQVVSPAVASKQVLTNNAPDGSNALEINVFTNSTQSWHVQFYQGNLHVTNSQPYTIAFWAKTEQPRTMTVRFLQQNSPWGGVSLSLGVSLSTNWQRHTVYVTANADEYFTRLDMTGLGTQTGKVWFASISVRPGSPGTGLPVGEALGTVGLIRKDQFSLCTRAVCHDWMAFMADTELTYWKGMRDYVKSTLGAKALVIGTQTSYSPASIQTEMDVVDAHAYWQHPAFPGVAWDGNNWNIKNQPMAGLAGGGTLTGIAPTRVAGKPFICTEYNHPAPNTYGAEALLLLASYAALQGWDAIFAYNYLNDTNWSQDYVSTWFNCGREPAKLIGFPLAAAIIRRGDVSAANRVALAVVTPSVALEKIGLTDTQLGATDFGVDGMLGLQNQVGIAIGAAVQLSVPFRDTNATAVVSDTGELAWNTAQKVVTLRAPLAKALIGDANQQTFDLGHGVVITPGDTMQRSGWCALTLLVREGTGFQSPGSRILLTATGYTDNHRQIWSAGLGPTNATSMVASTNWGSAPTLLEGISAAVVLARPASSVSVWALDERGGRKAGVPVEDAGGQAAFTLSRDYRTAWYEILLAATPQEAPYEFWKAGHFAADELADPAVSGFEADPDGDGLSNLFEYALGTDPRGLGVGGRYVAGVAADGLADYLTVTAARNPDATDVRFVADVSADLARWTNDVTVLQDDPAAFSARDNTPVSAAPRRFLRLKVLRP